MLSQWQIIVINTAIFFGHYVIISSALNFQFGNGGIPNMSSNVSGVDYVGIMRDESSSGDSFGGSSAP